MRDRYWLGALALILVCSLSAPGGLAAQETPVTFDGRAGVGLPVGNLGDMSDPGPAFNVGVAFGLTDSFLLRVTGGAELYEGVDLGEPLGNEGINDLDLDLIHFHAGGLYHAVPQRRDRGLSVSLEGTAGLTNFHVPRLATSVGTDAIEFEISELYFSAAGGVSVGYRLHEQVDLFLDGHTFVVFGDEEDTEELRQVVNEVQSEPVETLDTMVSVPVTLGVRLHF